MTTGTNALRAFRRRKEKVCNELTQTIYALVNGKRASDCKSSFVLKIDYFSIQMKIYNIILIDVVLFIKNKLICRHALSSSNIIVWVHKQRCFTFIIK